MRVKLPRGCLMNKRILKKLCKRAAPLLLLLRDRREQFRCSDDYWPESWQMRRMDRKSYERWGGKVNEHRYYIPLRNTIAVGCMSGYEEPEWDDCPAWEALKDHVFACLWVYDAYDPFSCGGKPSRRLDNPRQILAAARDLAKEKKGEPR